VGYFLGSGKMGETIGGANAPKRFKRILLEIVLAETTRHVRLRRCICHPLFFVDVILPRGRIWEILAELNEEVTQHK
jgi:hypothetical protein